MVGNPRYQGSEIILPTNFLQLLRCPTRPEAGTSRGGNYFKRPKLSCSNAQTHNNGTITQHRNNKCSTILWNHRLLYAPTGPHTSLSRCRKRRKTKQKRHAPCNSSRGGIRGVLLSSVQLHLVLHRSAATGRIAAALEAGMAAWWLTVAATGGAATRGRAIVA